MKKEEEGGKHNEAQNLYQAGKQDSFMLSEGNMRG